ncbi:MAG: hypothetical protein JST40_12800 [Armatimonadetes bacterium]|nr:hypothetical protein [Armatimonadota bacterium]
MPMRQINFRQIVPRLGSQDEAFEELCCQVARHEAMPEGSEFVRIRGAGGDGGVECVWTKADGTKSGWQAKFIFDFGRALIALTGSLATALKVHPTLSEFVVCLPYDITGEITRQGKSQQEKFDEWKKAEIAKAQASGRLLSIDLRTPSSLLDRLTTIDPTGGKLRFWFDETLLGPNWFANHLADVRAASRPRYTPELRIDTPTSLAFDALCGTPVWRAGVLEKLKKVKEELEDWERGLDQTGTVWGAPFPSDLMNQGIAAKGALESLLTSFESLHRGKASVSDLHIGEQIQAAETIFRTITAELRVALESEHGAGLPDNASWKQFQAEYQGTFPAQHYDKGKEIVQLCTELQDWIEGEVINVNGRLAMLLTGQAGVGKTHAICDAADRRLDGGLLTIVGFAEALPGFGEVADSLRAKLGLPADIGRDELLSIVNTAGEMSDELLLIAIDGLNETQPRSYWLNQLPAWISQISRFPFLRLCVSCRTTYVEHVIPRTLDIARVDHLGFAGMEFEACREFCEHYELEHPATPFLAEEFANALFLRLVCEAARDDGLPRIPAGSYGTRSAINTFLASKDKRYTERFGADVRHRYPSRAVAAIADEITRRQTRSVSFHDSYDIIAGSCKGAADHILEWLIEEGLIRVDAVLVDGQYEDHVFLPFERLGDHLLAERHLEGETAESIQAAFHPGGKLTFLLDELAWDDLAGLREAVALQIPESFGIELPTLAADSDTRRAFEWLTLRTLTWRDSSKLTVATSEIIQETAEDTRLLEFTLEQQLFISLNQSPIDAYWLDQLLKADQLANRDRYWCKYLHLSYERGGSVRRLIDTAFNVDANMLPAPSVERWCIVLGWFCAAADRRVRDSSTKAMVRLLTDHPALWFVVVSNFLDVDDDYVVERSIVATYGAMLRNPQKDQVGEVANLLLERVFANTTSYQNALIRDHCRSMIELGIHLGVVTDEGSTSIQPPYDSEWPLRIPTAQETETLRAKIKELPAVHRSCFSDDFFIYTMSRFEPYETQIPRSDMAGWIFQEIFHMGYNMQCTIEYDSTMSYRYGQGRGRPTWAERIGKKYQWIALARLAARLGDHLTPEEDDWDEESLVTPFVYERGRDTDPSVITPSDQRAKVSSWWSSYSYPFQAFDSMTDEDWVAFKDDIPELQQFLQAKGADGCEWIQLRHYPEWNSRHDSEDVAIDRNYRLFWLQVHSYLVDRNDSEELLKWAEGANWFNRWMPDGRDYHDGFVGEYPWGTPFQLAGYECDEIRRPDNHRLCPTQLTPTVHTVAAEYEYDCFQQSTVRIYVPSQEFFDERLAWIPESGYRRDGRRVFFDPTLCAPGPPALLVDTIYLKDCLEAKGKAIFFTILGEKLATGDNDKPRMVVSAGATFDGTQWIWTPVSRIMH